MRRPVPQIATSSPAFRGLQNFGIFLFLGLSFGILSPVIAQSESTQDRQNRYQDLYKQYTEAVARGADKTTLEKLTADMQSVRPSSLAETSSTTAPGTSAAAQAIDQAVQDEPSGRAAPKPRSPEEQDYDRLIGRLYTPDRLAMGATLVRDIQQFLQKARNPYFVRQATFELAALSFDLTRDPASPKAVLDAYAKKAPDAESLRMAKARIALYGQEKKIEEARAVYAKKNQKAVEAWTAAGKSSWLAFPVKLTRLTKYFFLNLERKRESRVVQTMIEEYDRLMAQTNPAGSLDAFTNSKLIPCNDLTLMVNGRTSFAHRYALAAAAQDKIVVQTLLYHNDETGNRLSDILIDRAKAGVDVRVIVDDAFATGRKTNILRRLENGGVKVLINNPIAQNLLNFNFRSHQKIFLVDNEVAIVGGMNIANEYALGEVEEYGWRDTDIEVCGPVVTDISDLFERNWEILSLNKPWAVGKTPAQPVQEKVEKMPILPHREKLIPGPLPIYFAKAPTFTNVRVRFLKTFPLNSKDDDILDLYTSYMSIAKKEIIFESAYFIPTTRLKEAILEACQRGVKVRILTNSVESNNHPNAGWAGRANYEDVLKGGAEIYEWQGSQTVHSKISYFDGFAASLGAYNVNSRSHSSDAEDILSIEDPRFANVFRQVLAVDLKRAKRVTLQDFEKWRGNLSERFLMDFYNNFKGFF